MRSGRLSSPTAGWVTTRAMTGRSPTTSAIFRRIASRAGADLFMMNASASVPRFSFCGNAATTWASTVSDIGAPSVERGQVRQEGYREYGGYPSVWFRDPKAILHAPAGHPCNHLIYSLAL